MFLNEFFKSDDKNIYSLAATPKDTKAYLEKLSAASKPESDTMDPVTGSGALAGAAAGAAAELVKRSKGPISTMAGNIPITTVKGAAKGALPGLALGQTVADTARYAQAGKYGQAALAAGGGIAGLALGPMAATVLPAGAAAINYCIDNPEDCKDLLSGAGSERAFKKTGRTPIRPEDLAAKGASSRQGSVRENLDQPTSFAADTDLIKSIVDVESGGRADAVSPKGALGRMQVMPATAKNPGFGVKPAQDFSSQELERVGQDYFNAMLNRYGGDKRKALIAYNMGPGAADKWIAQGGDPAALPRETQAYVPKVLGRYSQRTQDQSGTGAAISSGKPTTPSAASQLATAAPAFSGQTNASAPTSSISPTRKSALFRNKLSAPSTTFSSEPELATSTNVAKLPEPVTKMFRDRKRIEKDEFDNLMRLFNHNPEIFKNLGPELTNLVQSLGNMYYKNVAESKQLTESISNLVNLIYNKMELNYGDIVSLYGHEVVGDAIEQVAIKHEDDPDIELNSLAKEVLNTLKQRYEKPELPESDQEDDSIEPDVDNKNAMIQLQADVDKIKNTLGVKEGKIYFNVLATSHAECKNKFHLSKDNKGWYLKESAHPKIKLDALRAFQTL